MEVTQCCDVCGEDGPFLPGRVRIIGLSWPHQSHVAQCPECRRFFCLSHCEGIPVELDAAELREHGGQIAKLGEVPRLLCCPLDLDTPLGDADEEGHLFVASEGPPARTAAPGPEARLYLRDPRRYVEEHGGFVPADQGFILIRSH